MVEGLRKENTLMKFSEAIKEFSQWKRINTKENTTREYELDLRLFCLYEHNPEIENVSVNDVTGYFNLQLDLGYKPNSFTTKSIAIRKFFEYFALRSYNVLNYLLIPVPRREYNQPRTATEEDYEKFLGAIPESNDPRHIRNRAITTLLWDSGARIGELLSLKVQDINLEKKQAIIKTEKSRGIAPFRQIFWTDITNHNLIAWIKKRNYLKKKHQFCDPDTLFVGSSHWQLGRRLSGSGICTTFRRYSAKAGVMLNPHSLRHAFGHRCAKQNLSNSVISKLMGHASLQSSYVYTALSSKELEQQYRKFVKG